MPRKKGQVMKRVLVSLTDETYDKVLTKSSEHGISMSALMSIMATEWLEAKSMVLSLEHLYETSKREKEKEKIAESKGDK